MLQSPTIMRRIELRRPYEARNGINNFYELALDGTVNEDTERESINFLTDASRNPHSGVVIRVLSDGGSVPHALAICRKIQSIPNPTVTIGDTFVSSAAVQILLSADRRLAITGTQFTTHDIIYSRIEVNGDHQKLTEVFNRKTRDKKTHDNLFMSATGMPEDEYREFISHEREFFEDEAMRLGIIHEVIPSYPPVKELHSLFEIPEFSNPLPALMPIASNGHVH